MGVLVVASFVVVFVVATLVVRAARSSKLAVGIGVWLAIVAILAASGFLRDFDARPPRLPFVVVGAFTLGFVALRSEAGKKLLATPLTWPIAIQTMRIPIELGLWTLHDAGLLPPHLTFEGRNPDIVVGITAPVVAFALSRGVIGPRVAIGWNVLSLLSFFNIVGMAVTSIPGPLHLPWPGMENRVVAEFPFVWLPTFLVPVAFFAHVVSLRQLVSSIRAR